ncbi:hypothetical protein [Methylobacterium sp. J-072]|nr:hypothetical protein [Methylobacterium sp. J-072]
MLKPTLWEAFSASAVLRALAKALSFLAAAAVVEQVPQAVVEAV